MNKLELLMKKVVRKETSEEVRQRMQGARISVAMDKYFGLGGAAKRRARTSDVTAAKPRRIEAPVYQKFDVLVPVRHMAWESYHTATTEHQGTTIAKDLAQPLGLWVDLPSMDMKDSMSRRAVICMSSGDTWGTGQSFVYLRKDLFDRYLAEHNFECIWGIWGEKDYSVEFINSKRIEELPGRRWKAFKNAHIYPIGG